MISDPRILIAANKVEKVQWDLSTVYQRTSLLRLKMQPAEDKKIACMVKKLSNMHKRVFAVKTAKEWHLH